MWLALAVIPVGWSSAVVIIQHLHTRIATNAGACWVLPQLVVGKWVFDFQHRRLCFAAFDQICGAIHGGDSWLGLFRVVGEELHMCSAMVALIFTDMRAELSSTVYYGRLRDRSGGALVIRPVCASCGGRSVFRSKGLGEGTIQRRSYTLKLLRRADPPCWPQSAISLERWKWRGWEGWVGG